MSSTHTIDVDRVAAELAGVGIDGITIDDLIGGRVALIQPKTGYRVSMDTVLLAASVPAQDGERVLEAGTGSGGAALCLAHRCPGVHVEGLEIQQAMAAVARRNAALNGMEDRFSVTVGCITAPPAEMEPGSFDHVFANPPYLERCSSIRPPARTKDIAHMNSTAALKDWVDFCLAMVRVKGTISFIYRADRIDELISLLYRRAGDLTLLPLWPHAGQPAKRILVQGRKGTFGVSALLPGIALHGDVDNGGQRYTAEAEAILRDGGAVDLCEVRKRACN